MFDFFTYFIYLLLLTILVLVTSYRLQYISNDLSFDESPKLRLQHFFAIFLISVVVGFRYEVGVDWEGYKTMYESIKDSNYFEFSDQSMELGYFYINKIIAKLGLSYGWMFFTVALITWYFLFNSVPKLLLPLFIFFIFIDEYFFWGMNGVRQFAAISIWLIAIREIINKNLKKYILLILIASLFHLSVLILIPFYFIPYSKIKNKYFWIALLFISLVIGSSDIFVNYVQSFTMYIGQKNKFLGLYLHYIESNKLLIDVETKAGLGFTFRILMNILIIALSTSVLNKYPKATIYFILFFIGAVLFNLSYNIQLLGRINNYFLVIRSIVLAITVYFFWQKSNNRILIIGFCLLYFTLFLTAIYNSSNLCSPYRFLFMVF